MTGPPVACTVRDCGLLLERDHRTMKCARGHSYDVARRGYVNLLQPQDRRSPTAGDSKEAVAARARLLAHGIGRQIVEAIVVRAAALPLPPAAVVADLGCGTGDALARLAALHPMEAVGIDLSLAAIDHAARQFPQITWLVANADRRLPLLDRSVDLVLSLHGRRNPVECARVLVRAGLLLVAVPAQDDLAELRESVLGPTVERDRVDTVLLEHEPWFDPVERSSVRERKHLDRAALRDLLRSTYRAARFSAAQRADSLENLDVTLSSDVVLLGRR